MGRRNEKRDITRPTIVLPEPELPPDVWFHQPLPPSEWWEERWLLQPEDRWMRDAIVAIDETSARQPIDELALLATHEGDKKAIEEFLENSHARRIGLLRWKGLAEVVTFSEDLDEVHAAIGLLETLTTVLSAALDRLDHPRFDPTPMWVFRNAGWKELAQRRARQYEYEDSELLRRKLVDALPLVNRVEALSLEMPPADDILVTATEIAQVVHRSAATFRRYRKELGPPTIPNKGRKPAKWRWSQVLPILKVRFPGIRLPEDSASLRRRLSEKL